MSLTEIIVFIITLAFMIWAVIYMRPVMIDALSQEARKRDLSTFNNQLQMLGITGELRTDYEQAFLYLPACGVTPDEIQEYAQRRAIGRQ